MVVELVTMVAEIVTMLAELVTMAPAELATVVDQSRKIWMIDRSMMLQKHSTQSA